MYRNTSCLLQAHKGVSADAPENTMPAYRLAKEQGYDLIEADPKFTKDNVCIMMHDKTLNRTVRVNGEKLAEETPVVDMTYAEISNLDVGEWKDPSFRGTRIPLLSDLLKFGKEADIEVKIDNVMEKFSIEQQEMLFDLVRQYGGKVGITGAHLDFLERVAKALPHATLHYDGPIDEDSLNRLDKVAAGHELYIWARYDNEKTAFSKNEPINAEMAKLIKLHGKLGVWILSKESEIEDAIAYGADIVETNGEIKP